MKQLKTKLVILFGILAVVACNNEKGKINKEQIENNEILRKVDQNLLST